MRLILRGNPSDYKKILKGLDRSRRRWDPLKHPRGGNPRNRGQFSKVDLASLTDPEAIEWHSARWVREKISLPDIGDFTSGEIAAIINYKTPLHEAINNYLAFGDDFELYPEPDKIITFHDAEIDALERTSIRNAVLTGAVRPMISDLSSAISKGILKKDAVVYRGIVAGEKDVNHLYQAALDREARYFNRFTSTTLVKAGAIRWARRLSKKGIYQNAAIYPTLMEIALPAGVRVLDYPVTGKEVIGDKLDSLKLGPGKGGIDNEAELLLPQRMGVVVDDVSISPGGFCSVKITVRGDER